MTETPIEFEDLPIMHPPQCQGECWTVMERWVSPSFDLDGKLYRVEVLPGYQTDGASVPRIAWTLIGHPMQQPLLGPALVHDILYSSQLTRNHSTADEIFLYLMRKTGSISWVKRNTVWSQVRLWGWIVWSRHTEQSITKSRELGRLIPA